MRMPTRLPVVMPRAVGALLLAALAVILIARAQTAYAQSPFVSISIGEGSLAQGESTWLAVSFHNLPKASDNEYELADLTYRIDLERNDNGMWVNANSCSSSVGGASSFNPVYRNPKTVIIYNFTITRSCQTGSYRVNASVKRNGESSDLGSDIREFTVTAGPSVTVKLGSTSLNRGTTGSVTLEFHDLRSGESYSYSAYVMQRSPANYADGCSGSGLGT